MTTLKGKPGLGLFEFLEEAELQHYYNGLKSVLQVHNVQQLKYVMDEDLANIGMSRPEARRLRTFYNKVCPPPNVAAKLRKFLLPGKQASKDEARQEFLLGNEEDAFLHHGPSAAGSMRIKDRRHSVTSTASARSRSLTHQLSSGGIRVPSQHVIPSDAISIVKELGAGEFGVVQQGVWTDEDRMRHQVAIKCLSKERMQNNTVEFMKEYEFMQSIDHPNVVRLFGVVLDSAEIMLVTELAPLRSLLECLKEPSLRATFSVPCLATFAGQIAEGMHYLEKHRLIHRDLAARNILVFSKNQVKVSDFGLSRALGVGKDYYQTNFNVNLKLPIAWCAPECINFLKFTSASDVWAFGVTLWEMFSYGFQPWAAQTGQQILEAIDEPNSQRLDQPIHCPREHYQIMHQCWTHEPSKRPTFEELISILDDAKPEQVQAVTSYDSGHKDMLAFDVGDVITVLDKQQSSSESSSSSPAPLWFGALSNGGVGYFSPTHTVTYIGTLPSQGNHTKWQNEELYQSTAAANNSHFQRSTLRSSKGSNRGSKKKISRDMISAPSGVVQHTGHVGLDGAFFGDVGAFSSINSASTMKTSWHPSSNTTSTLGKATGGLKRTDSDASERAPLIAGRGGSTSSAGGNSVLDAQSPPNSANSVMTTSAYGSATNNGANKNPRMGYAIGYLRKSSNGNLEGPFPSNAPISLDSGLTVKPPQRTPHEYQTISDDEFGGPLDLGPSLMDEVFSELDSSKDSEKDKKETREKEEKVKEKPPHHRSGHGLHNIKEMKELVSSTLTLSSRKYKKKQQATVKPIKASDEKTLDDAIAMANALASKSMHDLDKRCIADEYDASPVRSPLTPNTPSKKFSFWFPSGKGQSSSSTAHATSPKSGGGRHFSEEANANADLDSLITPGAKDAYKALIDGMGSSRTSLNDPSSPRSPSHQPLGSDPSLRMASSVSSIPEQPPSASLMPPPAAPAPLAPPASSNNVLPLPPKSTKLNLSQPPKRHVRKNPLIIPSGMSANVLRRETSANENMDLQVQEPSLPLTSTTSGRSTLTRSTSNRRTSSSIYSNPPLSSTSGVTNYTNNPNNNNAPAQTSTLYSRLAAPDARSLTSTLASAASGSNRLMTQSMYIQSTTTTANNEAFTYDDQANKIDLDDEDEVDSEVIRDGSLAGSEAFENEIAFSMDALDHIPDTKIDLHLSSQNSLDLEPVAPKSGKASKKKEDSLPLVLYNQDHVSCEDLLDFRPNVRRTRGKARGSDSDEVRIMRKVLGVDIETDVCVSALDTTEWNVHHAIKLIKIKNLIKAPGLTENEMKVALQTRDWDVAKAASVLMKKIKE